ncbi:MAG: hypothetical protein SWX82_24660 [Cyanobacteriota bacterium]|nr:hypothetical protein [Cyanobacteriota bacterium]
MRENIFSVCHGLQTNFLLFPTPYSLLLLPTPYSLLPRFFRSGYLKRHDIRRECF